MTCWKKQALRVANFESNKGHYFWNLAVILWSNPVYINYTKSAQIYITLKLINFINLGIKG